MPVPSLVLALTLATAAPSPGPTVAREDTMTTQVPEVLVRAPRVTLDEILDRVARGEARRESLITDEQFTAVFRIVSRAGTPREELLSERVIRVFKKFPDKVRTLVLREYEKDPKAKKGVRVDFRGGMDEEIVNFAFRPAARQAFRYHILGRDFVGGHLVYRIGFEPRSPLDPSEPNGQVWVDTNDFVIVRQEIAFARSPVPLFIKDIHHMVVERRRVGDYWVLHRVLLRAETTLPLPKVGKSFDFSMRFEDYSINEGIPDAFFEASGTQ